MKKKLVMLIAMIMLVMFMAQTTSMAESDKPTTYLVENMITSDVMYKITYDMDNIKQLLDPLPLFFNGRKGASLYLGAYIILPLRTYIMFNSDHTADWYIDYYKASDTQAKGEFAYYKPINENKIQHREKVPFTINGRKAYWQTAVSHGYNILMFYTYDENGNPDPAGRISFDLSLSINKFIGYEHDTGVAYRFVIEE